jgi:hypothetical protein
MNVEGERRKHRMNGNSVSARLDSFPTSRFHRRLLLASGFGWLFDAMDVGLIGFVAAALVTQWNQIGRAHV